MTLEPHGLSGWQRLWFICVGATSALVATSVNQFPSLSEYNVTLLSWFFNPVYSGWIWALLAVEAVCIGSGIVLLTQTRWRKMFILSRLNWAFAFFALAWLAGVAFLVRFNGETPVLLLWLALVAIVILSVAYWLWRRQIEAQEVIFP